MTLLEFVMMMGRNLFAFKRWWEQASAAGQGPYDWPATMSSSDWLDQFIFFLERSGK